MPQSALFLPILLKALATFSWALQVTPRLRALESDVCRTHYRIYDPGLINPFNDSVPEELCKIAQVQTDLAYLLGWDAFFQNIPAFIVGFLYSVISERVDRKTLLLLNVACHTVEKIYFYSISYFYNVFDIRLIWAASLFNFVGGGLVVFNTLTLAMIAEAVPASSLTNVFFNLTSSITALRMLGVTGGSYLTSSSPWLPITLGLFVMAMTIPVCLLLRAYQYQMIPQNEESEPLVMDEMPILNSPRSPSLNNIGEQTQHENKVVGRSSPKNWLNLVKTSRDDALTYKLPLSIFVVHQLGMGILDIAQQWMSKRYAWSIQTAGYILASETLLSAVILASLPKASAFLLARWKTFTAEKKDLLLMKCTLTAAAAGAAVIALAERRSFLFLGLAVFAFGAGFHDALKSFVTARLRDPAQVTRVYLWISMLEVAANMINGPFWALMYTFSLRIGGMGLGLPFLLSSGACVGIILLVRRLR
ncbi:MAG: hypothetical protein HETSPECPRED_007929 [Heterodermia speciosa]|uniref:Uncharacterized protein n=1 Tax=Heterodermia speciosa TaxID=116794 RepID=A0A8H3EL61_9LECA|nr:MAG: hypothetical protein HETSPECPRED_007929 [Heterodermia speciosa]